MLVEFGGDKDMKNQHSKLTRKHLFNNFNFWIQPLVNLMFMTIGSSFLLLDSNTLRSKGYRRFSPKDQEFPGLGDEHSTMIVDSETQEVLVDATENWRFSGDILLRPVVGATFFSKKDLGDST